MSLKEITIIITTLRSEANINSCLDSIDSSVKVIIVENSNNLEFKKNIEKKINYPVSRKSKSRPKKLRLGPKFFTCQLARRRTRITL